MSYFRGKLTDELDASEAYLGEVFGGSVSLVPAIACEKQLLAGGPAGGLQRGYPCRRNRRPRLFGRRMEATERAVEKALT
jgi:hypothetical protein